MVRTTMSSVVMVLAICAAPRVLPQVGGDSSVGTAASPTGPGLQPGDTFSDALSSGGHGPEMVVIPPGRYRMGCVSGLDCIEFEHPVHEVTIPGALAVSTYEVTFEDYDRFAAENGIEVDDAGWGRGRRPVVNVSWTDVHDYVGWLSTQTGQHYRLLTEAEWEYAARAGSGTAYAWGNDVGENRANCAGCGSQWDGRQTAPVGSFEPNAFGLHDMHGNAWEWVDDCWNGTYVGAPEDGSARLSGDCRARVMRGGSWNSQPVLLRSADRVRTETRSRSVSLGFRVARELSP